jgi:predicted DNA-binding antitoxin AbrB/MazE fold protein
MPVVEAVYENGVFRPVTPVPHELREGDRVIVAPIEVHPTEHRNGEATVRDILARRYRSGTADTAARHDEHQP